jgi:glycosyltransferase involved in cell wall biosynthesis
MTMGATGAPAGTRPRITVVVPLPPSYRGGTEEYAYTLVERYSHRADVSVATTTVRWDPSSGVIPTGEARVDRVPAREKFERPIVFPWARRALLARVRGADLLQLHMPFPGVERAAVATARREGTPIVLTYHMDADLSGVRRSWTADRVTSLYRALSAHPTLAGCDAVVSNSRGYAEASPVLSRHLAKVRVIHKGVDPRRLQIGRGADRSRPACVPASAVPPGGRSVVFVGRLVPYKGVPVLLEAFAELERMGRTDIALLLAGRGPLRAALEAQAHALGIADRVHFLGFVPDDELGALYRFADLVAAPSISTLEATATALEEAASCGTPVIGTTLPGVEETVPHDGYRGALVPPGDPHRLAAAIARMAYQDRPEPPARIRTWEDVAQDYWTLFGELGLRAPPFLETERWSNRTPDANALPAAARGAAQAPGG